MFVTLPAFSQVDKNSTPEDEGIDFYVGSWNSTLKWADIANKPIFAYIHSPLKKDCEQMLTKVFTNHSLTDLLQDNFVSVKVDMQTAEGIAFRTKHEIREYPMYMFFDDKGNVIGQEVGALSIDRMIDLAQQYATSPDIQKVSNEENNPFYTDYIDMNVEYENGNRHTDFLYDYTYMLKDYNESYDHVVAEYLKKPRTSDKALQYILDFSVDTESIAYKRLVNDKNLLKLVGLDAVDKKVRAAIETSVVKAANSRSASDMERALASLKKVSIRKGDIFEAEMRTMYYETVKDWNGYSNAVAGLIDKQFNKLSADYLSTAAWNVVSHLNTKEQLAKAEAWITRAVELEANNYQSAKVNAVVQYQAGKRKKATKEIDRAIYTATSGKEKASKTELSELRKIQSLMKAKKPLNTVLGK